METEHSFVSAKNVADSFKYWPRIFKLLWNVNKKYLIIITFLYCVSGLVPAVIIIVTQNLINTLQLNANKDLHNMLFAFLVYIAVNYFGTFISNILAYFENVFQLRLNLKLNTMVLEKASLLQMKDFENSEVYDKLKRAQNETGSRPYDVFTMILSLISQCITLITSMLILAAWKWWVIFPILIMPVVSSIYMINLGYLQYRIQWLRAQKQRKSGYLSFILTNDIAFKEIKLYGLSDFLINKFKNLNEEFVSQDKMIAAKRAKAMFVIQFFDEVIGALVVWMIIKAAYLGEILIGNTIAYIRCISSIQGYTQGILSTIANLYKNNLYIKQFFDFLDLQVEEKSEEGLADIKEIESIEFKNVSFKYSNRDRYVLKNISFKLIKGEKIALVGQNGSGKTTLVKLISGFYNNYEGEIYINGLNINKIKPQSIKEKMGIIFQDFTKYEMTVKENIGFGKLDYMNYEEKLRLAADRANALEAIENLPDKFDNQLGVWFEDGIQLSGGQWQKIALSRAFLREAECYILDEPSSALDPVAEYEIFKKLSDLTQDKIGIFITHRLFNVKRVATRILVLSKGELIEEGEHNELMKKNGHYSSLYKLQNKSS